jgi:hypothetical protein
MPLCACGFDESKDLQNNPVSNGMAFVPRSSNQFHCYRFRVRFVKRKQGGDPPNTSLQQQNITQNLFSAVRLHRGLLPSLEGNRDFLRLRTHARDETDSELSAHLESRAADVSKNKNGADVLLVRLTVAF